jgi:hypothetical protein
MQICTRALARTPKHARKSSKAPFILLEFFRRSRQDFRRGFAFDGLSRVWRRELPNGRLLPIVAPEPPVMDGYGSSYPDPKWDMGRPMSSYPHDLV